MMLQDQVDKFFVFLFSLVNWLLFYCFTKFKLTLFSSLTHSLKLSLSLTHLD